MKEYFIAGACFAAQCAIPAFADSAEQLNPTAYLEIGPSVLLTELEGEIDDLVLEDNISINVITGRAGVNLTEVFALEADLSIGTSGENLNESVSLFDIAGTFDGEVKVNYIAGVYAKAKVPLTPNDTIRAFGRVGYAFSEIEATGTVTADLASPPTIVIFDTPYTLPGSYNLAGSYKAERSGIVGGGGIEFDFTENLYLRGDATYFGVENAPTVSVSASIGYRF